MIIQNLTPAANPGGGTMALVATFDAQLTPDIRVLGLRLLRAPDGCHVAYAPTALGGRRSVTFGRSIAEAITAAALKAHSEHVTAHGPTAKIAA